MQNSKWVWRLATGTDVIAIKNLGVAMCHHEVDSIWSVDLIAYMRNLTQAIVNQYYSPGSELLQVAVDDQDRVLGYVWGKRGQKAPWSDEEMIVIQMVDVDKALSVRQRIAMIKDMIMIWEIWAIEYNIPIICSTTMRGDQAAFLRIHSHMGYDVRGSYAYKRLG